jgi:hypothetical protein
MRPAPDDGIEESFRRFAPGTATVAPRDRS